LLNENNALYDYSLNNSLKKTKIKIPWVQTLIKSGGHDSNLVGRSAIY
jgi:hypothetical protein